MDSITLVGLPLCTRSNNSGMAGAVKILREEGITDRLRLPSKAFQDIGDAELSELRSDSGPNNLVNFSQFLQDTRTILSMISKWDGRGLLLGLGGECSICVGTIAALKKRVKGEVGMVWIDAHGDFNTPKTTPSGYIGGMCLAFACGRGPNLNGIAESTPILKEENVVHLASRDLDPLEYESMSSSQMNVISASTLHQAGFGATVASALSAITRRCARIVCHLDVDSIDPEVMPAVNFPAKNGLSLDEVESIVDAVEQTDKLALLELAGFNPTLDPKRSCARTLVKLVSELIN